MGKNNVECKKLKALTVKATIALINTANKELKGALRNLEMNVEGPKDKGMMKPTDLPDGNGDDIKDEKEDGNQCGPGDEQEVCNAYLSMQKEYQLGIDLQTKLRASEFTRYEYQENCVGKAEESFEDKKSFGSIYNAWEACNMKFFTDGSAKKIMKNRKAGRKQNKVAKKARKAFFVAAEKLCSKRRMLSKEKHL